jgi:hypothetical protein
MFIEKFIMRGGGRVVSQKYTLEWNTKFHCHF